MIHPNMLIQLARKWRRVKTATRDEDACCSTSSVTDKGHCAMYTADGRRFEVPLVYLGRIVFSEMLTRSQEEFGFTSDGRITLPCGMVISEMAHKMSLPRRNASEEIERAFLSSMVMPYQHSSYTAPPVALPQQFAICIS